MSWRLLRVLPCGVFLGLLLIWANAQGSFPLQKSLSGPVVAWLYIGAGLVVLWQAAELQCD